jgi:hypothetical protein
MRGEPSLFDDLSDTLEELKELAAENYPDESALRLRGLYTLELLYYELLPNAARTVPFAAGMPRQRFPRSVEGMRELIAHLDELRDDTEVADYAAELANLGVEGTRAWAREQRGPWDHILTSTIYAAAYLEVALKGGEVKWARLGTQFALACQKAALTVEDCFEYARVLLRINLQNGPQPWNLTRTSQA